MLPYFVVFIVVIILSVCADNVYDKSKKISYLFSGIAIVILCYFAGYRAYSVGTDISIYGLWRYNAAGLYNNLFSYLSVEKFGTEYLYHGLNYVINHMEGSFQTFLFVLQLIPTGITFYIAYKQRDKGTFWLYITTYLFIWFNSSLNILRQTPAMFIMLYAFKYIEEKKYVRYLIATIIASMFHSSAMLCIIMPIIQVFSQKKNKYIYLTILVTAIYLIYFSLDTLSGTFANLPIIGSYASYLEEGKQVNFKWYFAIIKLIMIAFNISYFKKVENEGKNNLLVYYLVLDFVFYCASAFIRYGYRLSYYFVPYWIIFIPRIDISLKKPKVKTTYRLFIIALLIAYWIVRYKVAGYDGTIPYMFYN